MCKTKFLQMCSFSFVFTSPQHFESIIVIAFLVHFYCYAEVFTLILYITTLISRIFRTSTQIREQDFKKLVTLVQKRTLPFATTA